MLTLFASKTKVNTGIYKGCYTTILKNESGKIVSVYPPEIKQPSKNKKTIVHNCFTYKLSWVK